jgi:ATP-dependent Clp protease ATP-binding subunit ClpC
VVLLDEIEKAHPEVFNILLQILEDGHLTDAKGRRVDFRNTVIIMTSNVGAKDLLKDTSLGFRPVAVDESKAAEQQYDRMREKVLDQLKTQFRPEFLNRVDSVVVFRSLQIEQIRVIVELMLARVREQLKAQQIDLEISQEAKDHIIKLGYDIDYGARPLRRVIQNMVEDQLAEALLMGRFQPGMTVLVDKSEDAGLTIEPLTEKVPVEATA